MLVESMLRLTETHDQIRLDKIGSVWHLEAWVGESLMIKAEDENVCNLFVLAVMAMDGKLPLTGQEIKV